MITTDATREEGIIAGYLITDECRKCLNRWIRSLRRQVKSLSKRDSRRYHLQCDLRDARLEYQSYLDTLSVLNSLS